MRAIIAPVTPVARMRSMIRVTPRAVPIDVHPVIQGYVCPAVVQCIGLPLGSMEHQQGVVDSFFDLAAAFDLSHGGERHVLHALLLGDWAAARELCVGFEVYNAGLGLVRAAVDRVAEDMARSAVDLTT